MVRLKKQNYNKIIKKNKKEENIKDSERAYR